MKIPPVKEQSRPRPRAAARRGLLVDLRSVLASAGLTEVVEGSGGSSEGSEIQREPWGLQAGGGLTSEQRSAPEGP